MDFNNISEETVSRMDYNTVELFKLVEGMKNYDSSKEGTMGYE